MNTVTSQLVGKSCWGFAAGSGTGSIVSFEFGNKIPRIKKLRNPTLTEDMRLYNGELYIRISCVWRISSLSKVICSSSDSNDSDGPMLMGLNKILNTPIVNVMVQNVTYDCTVNFENKMKLDIFCNETNDIDGFDNYVFRDRKKYYVVSSKSKLKISEN